MIGKPFLWLMEAKGEKKNPDGEELFLFAEKLVLESWNVVCRGQLKLKTHRDSAWV